MKETLTQAKGRMGKALVDFQAELATVRTGRAPQRRLLRDANPA